MGYLERAAEELKVCAVGSALSRHVTLGRTRPVVVSEGSSLPCVSTYGLVEIAIPPLEPSYTPLCI